MRSLYCAVAVAVTIGLSGTALGATIYAADAASNRLYAYDTVADTLTAAPNNFGGPDIVFEEGGLSFHPAGQLYGAFTEALDKLYTIDVSTGQATEKGEFGQAHGRDISGIAFAPAGSQLAGTLFGIDSFDNRLVTINAGTGEASLFNGGDTGLADIGIVGGLGFDSAGILYMVDMQNDNLYRFEGLAANSPTASLVGSLPAELDRTTGLTFINEGGQDTLYVVTQTSPGADSELHLVDYSTPANITSTTVFGEMPSGIGGLAAVIPEPATLGFLGFGLLLLASRRR